MTSPRPQPDQASRAAARVRRHHPGGEAHRTVLRERPAREPAPVAGGGGFADARTDRAGSRSLQARCRTARARPTATRRSATPTCRRRARPSTPATTCAREAAFASALAKRPPQRRRARRHGVAAHCPPRLHAGLRYGAARARRRARRRAHLRRDRRRARSSWAATTTAERTLQRMVDLKPNLDSYARVSYFRELHGDLAGARRGDAAGGLRRRRRAREPRLRADAARQPRARSAATSAAAERAYRLALSRYPGYVPAQAGLGTASAIARGDLARRDPPLPRAWSRACRCPST